MAPYYKLLTAAPNPVLDRDTAVLEKLTEANSQRFRKLEVKLEEARKMGGESNVSKVLLEKAAYLTRIGHQVIALSHHRPG